MEASDLNNTIGLFSTISKESIRRLRMKSFKQLSNSKGTEKTELLDYYNHNGLLSSDVSVILPDNKSTMINSLNFKESSLKHCLAKYSNQHSNRLRKELTEIKPNIVLKRKGFETKELPLNKNYLELSVQQSQCPMVVRIHKGNPDGNESDIYKESEKILDCMGFEPKLPNVSGNRYVITNENLEIERYKKTVHKKRRKRTINTPSKGKCYVPHTDKKDWSFPSKLISSSKETYNSEHSLLKGSFLSSLRNYKNKIISATKTDAMPHSSREPTKNISTSFTVRALSLSERHSEQSAREHKRDKNKKGTPIRNNKTKEKIKNKMSCEETINNCKLNESIYTDNISFVSVKKKNTRPHHNQPLAESENVVFDHTNQISSDSLMKPVRYSKDNKDLHQHSFASVERNHITKNDKQRKVHKYYDEVDLKFVKKSLQNEKLGNSDVVILNASQNEFCKLSDFLKSNDIINKLSGSSILLISKFPTNKATTGSSPAHKTTFSKHSDKEFQSKKEIGQVCDAQTLSSITLLNFSPKNKKRDIAQQKHKQPVLDHVDIDKAQNTNHYSPSRITSKIFLRNRSLHGSTFNNCNESISDTKISFKKDRGLNKYDNNKLTQDLFEYDLIPHQDIQTKIQNKTLNNSQESLNHSFAFEENIKDKVSERLGKTIRNEMFYNDVNKIVSFEEPKHFPTSDSNVECSVDNLLSNNVTSLVRPKYNSKPLIHNDLSRQNSSTDTLSLREKSTYSGLTCQKQYINKNPNTNLSNINTRDSNTPNKKINKTAPYRSNTLVTNVKNEILQQSPCSTRNHKKIVNNYEVESHYGTPNTYKKPIDSNYGKCIDSNSKIIPNWPHSIGVNQNTLHPLNPEPEIKKELTFEGIKNERIYCSTNSNEDSRDSEEKTRNRKLVQNCKTNPHVIPEKTKNNFENVSTSVSLVVYESAKNGSRPVSPHSARSVSVAVQTDIKNLLKKSNLKENQQQLKNKASAGEIQNQKNYSIDVLSSDLNFVNKSENRTRKGDSLISAIVSDPSQFLQTKPIISDLSQFHLNKQNQQKDPSLSPKKIIEKENPVCSSKDKVLMHSDGGPMSGNEPGIYLKSFQRLDTPGPKMRSFIGTNHEIVSNKHDMITPFISNKKYVIEKRFSNKEIQLTGEEHVKRTTGQTVINNKKILSDGFECLVLGKRFANKETQVNNVNPICSNSAHIILSQNKIPNGGETLVMAKKFSNKETQCMGEEPIKPKPGQTVIDNKRMLNSGFECLVLPKKFSNKETQVINVKPNCSNSAHTILAQNKIPNGGETLVMAKKFSNKEPQSFGRDSNLSNSAQKLLMRKTIPKEDLNNLMVSKTVSNKETQFIGMEPRMSNSGQTLMQKRSLNDGFENLLTGKQFANKKAQFIGKNSNSFNSGEKLLEQSQMPIKGFDSIMLEKQFSNKETQFVGIDSKLSRSAQKLLEQTLRNNNGLDDLMIAKQFSNKETQFIGIDSRLSSSAQKLLEQPLSNNNGLDDLMIAKQFSNKETQFIGIDSKLSISAQKLLEQPLCNNNGLDDLIIAKHFSNKETQFIGVEPSKSSLGETLMYNISFNNASENLRQGEFRRGLNPTSFVNKVQQSESELNHKPFRPFIKSKNIFMTELPIATALPSVEPTNSSVLLSYKYDNESKTARDITNTATDKDHLQGSSHENSCVISESHPSQRSTDKIKPQWNGGSQHSHIYSNHHSSNNEVYPTQTSNEITKPHWNNIKDIDESKIQMETSHRKHSKDTNMSNRDSSAVANKKYISKENRSITDSQNLNLPGKRAVNVIESNISNPAFTCNFNHNDKTCQLDCYKSISSEVLSFSHIQFNITLKESETVNPKSSLSNSKPLETSLLLLPVKCSQSTHTENLGKENQNPGKKIKAYESSDQKLGFLQDTSPKDSKTRQSIMKPLRKLPKEPPSNASALTPSNKKESRDKIKTKKLSEYSSQNETESNITRSSDMDSEELTNKIHPKKKHNSKWKKLLKHKKEFKKINNLFMSGYVMIRLISGFKSNMSTKQKTNKQCGFKGEMKDYSRFWKYSYLEAHCSGDRTNTPHPKCPSSHENISLDGYGLFNRKFLFGTNHKKVKSKHFTSVQEQNYFVCTRKTQIYLSTPTVLDHTIHNLIHRVSILHQVKRSQSCNNIITKNNILLDKIYSSSEGNLKFTRFNL